MFVFAGLTSLCMIMSRSIRVAANATISFSHLNFDIPVKSMVPLHIPAVMASFKIQFPSHVGNAVSSALTASASWKLSCPRIRRVLAGSCHHHGAPTCIETELGSPAISTLYWSVIEAGNEASRINNTPHTPSQNQAPRERGGTWVPMSRSLQGETSSIQDGALLNVIPTHQLTCLWSLASSIWRSFSWSVLTEDPGAIWSEILLLWRQSAAVQSLMSLPRTFFWLLGQINPEHLGCPTYLTSLFWYSHNLPSTWDSSAL